MSENQRSTAESPSAGHEADPRVVAALRDLTRESASPGFTEAVLARVGKANETAAAEVPWSRSMMLLAASLVLVTVLTAGALERAHQRQELRGRVDQLKSEHEQLEHELAEIKRLSSEQPAVVYLGGDENVDVVWRLDTNGTAKSSTPTNAGVATHAAERN